MVFGVHGSGFKVQGSAPPLAAEASSLIKKETEVSDEGKYQIPSTKFQINIRI
jgi:hypothetical protein